MPNLLSKRRREPRRKRTPSRKLLLIKRQETKRSMRLNWKLRESRMRRKEKSRD